MAIESTPFAGLLEDGSHDEAPVARRPVKRQVAEEFLAGETLHSLSNAHDISRQLIRIWLGKFEAGALDEDVQAADLIQEYEAKIAALVTLLTAAQIRD